MRSAILLLVQKERQKLGSLAKHSPPLVKKVLLHIAGISLILLGIVGLFLPILQGVLLILAGLSLLSMGNEGVRRWINDLEKRYPRQALMFKRIKARVLFWKKSPVISTTADQKRKRRTVGRH